MGVGGGNKTVLPVPNRDGKGGRKGIFPLKIRQPFIAGNQFLIKAVVDAKFFKPSQKRFILPLVQLAVGNRRPKGGVLGHQGEEGPSLGVPDKPGKNVPGSLQIAGKYQVPDNHPGLHKRRPPGRAPPVHHPADGSFRPLRVVRGSKESPGNARIQGFEVRQVDIDQIGEEGKGLGRLVGRGVPEDGEAKARFAGGVEARSQGRNMMAPGHDVDVLRPPILEGKANADKLILSYNSAQSTF
jgi:hypothetical protein